MVEGDWHTIRPRCVIRELVRDLFVSVCAFVTRFLVHSSSLGFKTGSKKCEQSLFIQLMDKMLTRFTQELHDIRETYNLIHDVVIKKTKSRTIHRELIIITTQKT